MTNPDVYEAVFDKAVYDLAERYATALALGVVAPGVPLPCTPEERQATESAEGKINEAYSHRYILNPTTHKVIGQAITPEAFRELVIQWYRPQRQALDRLLSSLNGVNAHEIP